MRRQKPPVSAPPEAAAAVSPDPDQAWKALSLVNEGVRHAEGKLGLTLASTGVTGGVLFNLVKDRSHTSILFDIVAGLCGLSIMVAGVCAMVGLYPRVKSRRVDDSVTVNPLFFHDVVRAYRDDALSYAAVLQTLTADRDDLVRHLGQQIHANARVVQVKYRWADRAIRALLAGLLGLGVMVIVIVLKK
jgi:Family of unknown function (DUF5706)